MWPATRKRVEGRGNIRGSGTHLPVAALTPPCPAPEPSLAARIRHCFAEDELRAAVTDRRVDMIVHRGRFERLPGFSCLGSHVELGVVYANRGTGIDGVSRDQLLELLAGAPSRPWSGRDGTGEWRLFCHGGEVHRRALAAAFGLARLPVARDRHRLERLPTYEDLAFAGCETGGAIVMGLRGESALHPGLRVVTVDGRSPLEESAWRRYPLRYTVHIHVRERRHCEWSPPDHFGEIRGRIAVDQRVFETLRTREGIPDRTARIA